jgi:TRAP-type uncharacterized transport system fused permease subunit
VSSGFGSAVAEVIAEGALNARLVRISLHAATSATLGVILLAAGLFGYLLRPATWWQRAMLIAAALLLIKPGWMTDLAGLLLAGAVTGIQLVDGRRSAARGAP